MSNFGYRCLFYPNKKNRLNIIEEGDSEWVQWNNLWGNYGKEKMYGLFIALVTKKMAKENVLDKFRQIYIMSKKCF